MTRPLLNRRLGGLGNSVFGEMSARALATASINLGQGFPDTDGPPSVARAAADAVLTGKGNQYPPATGIPELRQAVARHQRRFYGLGYDPETEVLITAGATEAIAEALDLPDRYFTAMADDLRARRDLLAGGLKDIGFEVYQPDGTYFITTDIAPLGEKDAMDFCLALPGRAGVVAIPSGVFYDDNPQAGRTMVRFAFCKRPEVLTEALGRLAVLAR